MVSRGEFINRDLHVQRYNQLGRYTGKYLPRPEVKTMDTWTTALWCKIGSHAFDPDDPDKLFYTETKPVRRITGNSYGQPVYQDEYEITKTITICGPCYAKQRPFQTTMPEIPAGVDKQTYTEYLEALNKIPSD